MIGDNCFIQHHVCIGVNKGNEAPILGKNVFIGPYTCVLGGISIGDNCKIGAHSLVLKDCEPLGIYVGCPAVKVGKLPSDYQPNW